MTIGFVNSLHALAIYIVLYLMDASTLSLGAFVSQSATFGGLSGKRNLQDTDGDRNLEHQWRLEAVRTELKLCERRWNGFKRRMSSCERPGWSKPKRWTELWRWGG